MKKSEVYISKVILGQIEEHVANHHNCKAAHGRAGCLDQYAQRFQNMQKKRIISGKSVK
jgi:hypothetical protein